MHFQYHPKPIDFAQFPQFQQQEEKTRHFREQKMMAKFRSRNATLVISMVILCTIRAVPATVYTVGDSSGWAMGGDYATWASDKTFAVGDTLVFNYAAGHSVDEVSANDYKSCTSGNAITSDSTGATSVTLRTAGPHYFMCGVPGHCSGGMKLSVTVAAAASGGGTSPASGTTTSPSSSTTTGNPESAATSRAPPTSVATPAAGTLSDRPSSAAVVSPAVAAFSAFFVVVLKFFVL